MKKSIILQFMLCTALLVTGCQAKDSTSPSPGGSSENKAVSIDTIMEKIEAAYGEEYPANGVIPPEVLEAEFGLTADLYEEARGAMPMVSIQNDRVVVAKAREGKADEMEAVLQEARQRKIDDTLQYPMNIPKTNAAKVVRQGDYVAFLLIGRPNDEIQDNESSEAAAYAESEVQRGVDAFISAFS